MAKFFPALTLVTCALLTHSYGEGGAFKPKEIQLTSPKNRAKSPTVKHAFSPFTGKLSGDRVRMRLQPDLDGYIVKELSRNEVVSVIDQEGDFYAVAPPENLKVFIFRSFVLDDVVEGNRVNVRLEPDLEAPIIGHMNSGDRVHGEISSINKKWLEITPPSNTRFYIAKDFVDYIGGPEVRAQMEKRKETVAQLLEAANLFAQAELEKPFEEMDFERVKQGYLTIIHDYTDFPKKAELAKDALTHMQEEYLQKRIAYLENKAALVSTYTTQETQQQGSTIGEHITHLVKMWEPVEEALYASWAQQNDGRAKDEFYEQEKLVAITVSGTLEPFTAPVKNKPGDFIVKSKNLPVAYVYSTKVDLKDYVGKKVTLIGSPRENNSFAFPAYFVHEVE